MDRANQLTRGGRHQLNDVYLNKNGSDQSNPYVLLDIFDQSGSGCTIPFNNSSV